MTAPISPALAAAFPPPVMEARRWLAGRAFPPDRPLINLSQAAPVDAPPVELRRAVAEAALDDGQAHVYGPVLGDADLRAAVAERWSAIHAAPVAADEVAITAGCNQAFCAAVASVAAAGDEVVLPTPWYFNHKMWLDMAGVGARLVACGDDGLPDPDRLAAAIGPRTRAIVLVTPNNPTGAEYPPALLDAAFDIAAARGLALILDETYRDFRGGDGPPHGLFARPGRDATLIHLYSFSKVYRLTGHRVGALIAGPERLAQIEKFLDAMTICPGRLGQRGALYGLRRLGDWVAAERAEILRRRDLLRSAFAEGVGGWRLRSSGAYFAWAEHPFEAGSDAVAQALLAGASLLALPGTMFAPRRAEGGDGRAERAVRFAFANADADGLRETVARLRAFAM